MATRDAVAVAAVVVDLHLRAGGQRRGPRGVVHELAHLLQVDLVWVADVEVRLRAIGHDVRRRAALGDDALDARLGTHVAAHASMFAKRCITAVRALRPFQAVIWCAGAPEKVYFTPSMFRQHVPKPGAGRDVDVLAWLRTMTSMP